MANIQMPSGVRLVSFDRNVVHAQIKSNGMHLVVVPSGKGGSCMMRRLCVGGSRLEDASCAGAAHVIEHMDFRSLDWLKFSGTVKNASTAKTFIQHEAYMLMDPKFNHIKNELDFQRQTMLGTNLLGLRDSEILHEINNVRDEGAYNSQSGSAYRAVIMRMENMLLPRVWRNGWAAPTIGTDRGLTNLKTSDDMMRMHKMMRSPERTFLVLSGPVDVNSAFKLLHHAFQDIPCREDGLLRNIPESIVPRPMQPQVSTLSLNSGNRAVAIGGLKGAYNHETDVMLVMQHLVNMLGQQPAVKQHNTHDVTLYCSPEQDAGVFTLLAKASSDGDEAQAIAQSTHALQEHVIQPLLAFNDRPLLDTILKQYRQSLKTALQSGPQEAAEMAIQGILACNKPSWAWHVDDRFSSAAITPRLVRKVAAQMFDPGYSGVVYCTAYDQARPLQVVCEMPESCHARSDFSTRVDISHLARDKPCIGTCEYIAPSMKDNICKEQVYNASHDHVGTVAYNAIKVVPLQKRALTCDFGTASNYGGWAQASLIVGAMNAISNMSCAGACRYKLESQRVIADLESTPDMQFSTQPLITSLAMAMAVSGAVDSPDVRQMQATLPTVALNSALEDAQKMYTSPAELAMAQTRSQTCSALDAGYVPPDIDTATRMLSAEHTFVCNYLSALCSCKPSISGTNMCSSNLHDVALKISTLASEMPTLAATAQESTLRRNIFRIDPQKTMVQTVSGLQTYPYVAAMRGSSPLRREDRAALLITNQVMCGGMGAVYTHDVRQRGVSYRPSGSLMLSWQDNPILTLNATFSKQHQSTGEMVTKDNLAQWASGSAHVFTPQAVNQAKQSICEQVFLTSMDFNAQKYSMLANMDPGRFSTAEVLRAVSQVDVRAPATVLQKYFDPGARIYESWVTC